jgi:diguanylate cyclase (GGDEF)-like protein
MRSKLAWTNNELEDLLRQLDIALEASGVGIWQHNLRKNQTRWDEQLQVIYGVRKGEHDVVWLESVHPEDCFYASQVFQQAIATKSDYAAQFRIIRPDGETRHLRSRAKYFVDGQGEECFIGAEWDVTEDVLRTEQLAKEREAAEKSRAEARYAADHDYLTGLLNRRAFDDAFAHLRTEADDVASLCHLDIDRFKEINDRFGHAGGDAVLQHVAAILEAVTGETDLAVRLGGDEFAILSLAGAERMQMIAGEIRKALEKPILLEGEPFAVECSIGIASATGNQIPTLLMSSDVALYEAKKRGRNRDQFFTPALAEKLQHEKQTLQELRSGLQVGEIVPFYQIQVSASDGMLCGLEALARWESPGGLRPPSAFLGLAADHGLMEEIDDAILRRVLFDINRWTMTGVAVPRVSVNLSAARLGDPALASKLRSLSIPAGSLSFELIETIFLDTISEQIRENIGHIRDMGIEIELDDLGSGHASLLGLLELRPERVKIDRHLIAPLVKSSDQRLLVSSLINIARTLDMEVVAEGVETLEHASILTELGADTLQGFAFGRAESAQSILKRLKLRGSKSSRPPSSLRAC